MQYYTLFAIENSQLVKMMGAFWAADGPEFRPEDQAISLFLRTSGKSPQDLI